MKKIITTFSVVTIAAVMAITPVYAACGRGRINSTYRYTQTQENYSRTSNPIYSQKLTTQLPAIDIDSLLTARKAYLDSLVEQGVMTREYADIMLDNYRLMLEYREANGGLGYDGARGFGCHGGGHCGYYYQNSL